MKRSSKDEWQKLQKQIGVEFDAMAATASTDAEDIYACIVSPDDDPDIALYQLVLLNKRIRAKINFFSLIEFVGICRRNDSSLKAFRQHEPRRRAKESEGVCRDRMD